MIAPPGPSWARAETPEKLSATTAAMINPALCIALAHLDCRQYADSLSENAALDNQLRISW
ncbi:protein of unknown function [Candidatus Filomicrobium marinum]|uniref:Uncharacterized protein n=1 Tax=Candidatus Filomicrobium marinum TaxID=1608628 RepID=A0A0D6JGD0_9HYPH|nr:protein of unknown function [Candidatus Filomicrobium marinum]CPR20090.1 protein of unknown function [Candidatus Filomicrobium marinum]